MLRTLTTDQFEFTPIDMFNDPGATCKRSRRDAPYHVLLLTEARVGGNSRSHILAG